MTWRWRYKVRLRKLSTRESFATVFSMEFNDKKIVITKDNEAIHHLRFTNPSDVFRNLWSLPRNLIFFV